jgi:acyl-CoA thioester hydrolase
MRIRHEMRDDETGDVAATTEIVAVHLDAATRGARSLPEDVRARASAMDPGTGPGADGHESLGHNRMYAID